MAYTRRKKNFPVTIRPTDRAAMEAKWPTRSLEYVDTFAVLRAAQRNAMLQCRSTHTVLNCCITDVPKATVREWMAEWLAMTD